MLKENTKVNLETARALGFNITNIGDFDILEKQIDLENIMSQVVYKGLTTLKTFKRPLNSTIEPAISHTIPMLLISVEMVGKYLRYLMALGQLLKIPDLVDENEKNGAITEIDFENSTETNKAYIDKNVIIIQGIRYTYIWSKKSCELLYITPNEQSTLIVVCNDCYIVKDNGLDKILLPNGKWLKYRDIVGYVESLPDMKFTFEFRGIYNKDENSTIDINTNSASRIKNIKGRYSTTTSFIYNGKIYSLHEGRLKCKAI